MLHIKQLSNIKIQGYMDNFQDDIFLSQEGNKQVTKECTQVKKEKKQAQAVNKKDESQPYCSSCNLHYSCSSSFYHHVRTKHDGIIPVGSVAGPKGISSNRPNNSNMIEKEARKSTINAIPCKCGKLYSCKSSLLFHIKQKHENEEQFLNYCSKLEQMSDKSSITYDAINFKFNCQCGYILQTPDALKQHINKHHRKCQRKFKCFCGAVFCSRSALNLHLRRKRHLNNQIEPTSVKVNSINENESEAEEEKQSSDKKEAVQENQSSNLKTKKMFPVLYRCGCGSNYSCSSSLNLHIRRKHSEIIENTIAGSKGVYYQGEFHLLNQQTFSRIVKPQQLSYAMINKNQMEQQDQNANQFQQNPLCSSCRTSENGDIYFECNCRQAIKHIICSDCFWLTNYFQGAHKEWIIRKPKFKGENNGQDKLMQNNSLCEQDSQEEKQQKLFQQREIRDEFLQDQ